MDNKKIFRDIISTGSGLTELTELQRSLIWKWKSHQKFLDWLPEDQQLRLKGIFIENGYNFNDREFLNDLRTKWLIFIEVHHNDVKK